jgi:hypothetical protein
MKLASYRCERCNGLALVDVHQLPPAGIVPCPYCWNRYISNAVKYIENPNYSEMLPMPATVRWPDQFDIDTTTVRVIHSQRGK